MTKSSTLTSRPCPKPWRLIATIALAAACQRPPAFKIDDVRIYDRTSGPFIHYRTLSPSGDCTAQAAEMPKVWDLIVKERLAADSHVQRVVLMPEDPTGQSVGFEFIKGASGWATENAPCSFGIPGR
jgi:hypothetical protein